MDTDPRDPMSPARQRAGVFLILIWWIPVWLAAPVISAASGLDADVVLVGLIVIQTILGAFGALLAGRQISRILRGVPRKQMRSTVWHVFRHGSLGP